MEKEEKEKTKLEKENVGENSNKESESGSFEKIEVNPKSKVTVVQKRRIPKRLFFTTLLIPILLGIALVVPGINLANKARQASGSGRVLAQALKEQNIKETKEAIPVVRKDLDSMQLALTPLVWMKVIPFVNGYYNDIDHGIQAGKHGVDALEIAISAVEPYADLLGLEGESTFVTGSAEDRIKTAVQTLDKITPKLADIGEKVELLNNEIAQINPSRYPKKIGKTPVREQLIAGKELLEDSTKLFINARPFLEELPSLLGEPEPKRYFIIFQNDKEQRPTGGFLTAFAIFRMESGKPVVERSEDIYVLDEQQGTAPSAPEEIRTYHKGVYQFHLRDSNLSPDFDTSMQQFQDLYRDDFDFDGIIAVDTHVLVEALKVLGSFDIAGREFSSEIDERCDCPRVVYELEDYATRPVAYVRDNRKDILGSLLLQIMQRALGVSPSQYWGQLFRMGLDEIDQKHILANMADDKAQKAIESLNMGGRIATNETPVLDYKDESNWDYLHINDANFAGAKSNLFVEQSVAIDYEVEGGMIIKTITVDYKNPAEASDCNLESGGLCLNGLLRDWVRVYVPKGSELLESSGSQSPDDGEAVDMLVKESLGKTVFEGFLTVRPLGSAQLTIKYRLPKSVTAGKDYTMLLQKQPGTDANQYTISVNGKQKEQFGLVTDRLVQLSL